VSRGLGKVQRALLLAVARLEVSAAEQAAERQERYRPPRKIKLWHALDDACEHALDDAAAGWARRGERTWKAARAGDPAAIARLLLMGVSGGRNRLDDLYKGSLHESALSVRHLGRSMNGLRAGMCSLHP
jgi:hypothetical protein